MKVTLSEIKTKLESPSYGGSIEIEGGLGIRKIDYEDKFVISHSANIGREIATIQTDEEFQVILEKHQKYIEAKKELESKGYENMGHGTFFLKGVDGKTMRDEENCIIEKTLYWR